MGIRRLCDRLLGRRVFMVLLRKLLLHGDLARFPRDHVHSVLLLEARVGKRIDLNKMLKTGLLENRPRND